MIGTNVYQDVLHPRRATLNYVSPAICEAIFSGSSFATLLLEAQDFNRLYAITGYRYNYDATTGTWTLYWDVYPDALCYNVYTQTTPGNFTLFAECVTNPQYPQPPGGVGFPPGTVVVVTGVTPHGETPFPATPPGPLPPPPGGGGGGATTYYNVEYTATCPDGFAGDPVTIPANTYASLVSQADADQQAVAAAEFALSCTPVVNDLNFNDLVWTEISPGFPGFTEIVVPNPSNSEFYTGSINANPSWQTQFVGTLTYNAATEIAANLNVNAFNWADAVGYTAPSITVEITADAVSIFSQELFTATGSIGGYDFGFNAPVGVAVPLVVTVTVTVPAGVNFDQYESQNTLTPSA